MYKIVLIRHGESQWNKENRFTGWHDVDLSERGREEARKGGQALKKEGYVFDVAFTSVLKRAIRTLWTVLDEMDLMWIPVNRTWRLNERHYGNLTGLNKAETAAQHGEEQVKIWRRSFDIPPRRWRQPTRVSPPTIHATPISIRGCCRPPKASRSPSIECCPIGTTPSCPPSAPASAW